MRRASGDVSNAAPFPILSPREIRALIDARFDILGVALLPSEIAPRRPPWPRLRAACHALLPWPVLIALPDYTCSEPSTTIEGWMMTAALARTVLSDAAPSWRLSRLASRLLASPSQWLSALPESMTTGPAAANSATDQISVLALIPHYGCEAWLDGAIRGLVAQTRVPEAIVVIDDGSAEPPIDICRLHPHVTLLRSAANVGPYRLVQQVIEQSPFDAYFFQDADDWSCADRLALLLAAAWEAKAELVGTQELRISEAGLFQPTAYPLDVNAATRTKPAHPLLHPTSLVFRSLLKRIGGFANGLRFGGDTEFLYRAVFDARIVNTPGFSYFRRYRTDSLANGRDTGARAPSRKMLWRDLHRRAAINLRRRRRGDAPDLTPLCRAPPVRLEHLLGPALSPEAASPSVRAACR